MEGAGTAGLQSGFVLAAILAAVLFAGGFTSAGDDLSRRIFQVAVAVLVAFTAIGATTAFMRPPDLPDALRESSFDSGDEDEDEQYEYFEDVSNRNAAARTTHAGIGVLALLTGLALMRRLGTIPLGVTLGGLLLLLFGGVSSAAAANNDPSALFFAAYSSILGASIGAASQSLDIAHFVLVAAGLVALLIFGYRQWEYTEPEPAAPPPHGAV